MRTWHLVHDFVHGWGWWDRAARRTVWVRDVEACFGVPDADALIRADSDAAVEEAYRGLRPYLHAAAERMEEHRAANPIRFDRMTLPRLTAAAAVAGYPDLRRVSGDDPATDGE